MHSHTKLNENYTNQRYGDYLEYTTNHIVPADTGCKHIPETKGQWQLESKDRRGPTHMESYLPSREPGKRDPNTFYANRQDD